MRKLIVVANWKMNPQSEKEAKELFNSINQELREIKNTKVVICPPFVYLPNLKSQNQNIKLGGQDCFWENEGPFTGEVSPLVLKNLGCEYVILGHSERRQFLKETDEMIAKKIKASLDAGLKPVLCVSDKSQRLKKDIKEIRIQLEKGLGGIKKSELKNVIIVYEPIWAISSRDGMVATPKQAREAKVFIRDVLIKKFGENLGSKIKILYGGSVDSRNASDFISEAQMDGVLVGGASLNSKEFSKIVNTIENRS